jgi:hypothetical protein
MYLFLNRLKDLLHIIHYFVVLSTKALLARLHTDSFQLLLHQAFYSLLLT